HVVFVGHWEAHTERYVRALRTAGLDVRVWGHNWRWAADPGLRRVVPLPHAEYVSTIARSGCALCVLSRANRNESTGRSFEIPAIGALMLAERTPEHTYLYGDDEGAILFSNEDELVSKARYYLGRPGERHRIAQTGQFRVNQLGMPWEVHIEREWRIVERILEGEFDVADQDDAPFWPGFRQGSLPPGVSELVKLESELQRNRG
ncbi:MAG TPA: glycosyltransferase, partial [Bryobacteraceae bacterium]